MYEYVIYKRLSFSRRVLAQVGQRALTRWMASLRYNTVEFGKHCVSCSNTHDLIKFYKILVHIRTRHDTLLNDKFLIKWHYSTVQ